MPMSKKHFFICFTGMDGTGKTTQAKELTKSFNQRGIKCKYVYARLNPFILKPFILIGEQVFLRKKDIFENYSEYSNIKQEAIKKHSALSEIYKGIMLFDYLIQISINVTLPLILGKSIVCDRYVFDTIVTDISVDMDYSKEKTMRLLSKLLNLFPKPDMTFLIDVSEEIAFQRKDDTPSVEYLTERRVAYLEVAKEYNMILLDGAGTLEGIKNEIEKEAFAFVGVE